MLKKILKKMPLSAYLIVPCTLVFCIMIGLIVFRFQAKNMGNTYGEKTGSFVGKAVGSWLGMTTGWPEGIKDAIAEENTIPDAKAEITGCFQEVGKLEVLISSGKYTHSIKVGKDALELSEGEKQDVYYARLLSQEYKAIWTVDLNTVSINEKDGVMIITLDKPNVEFKRIGSPKTESEYLKYKKWNYAENGAIATVNAFNKLVDLAEAEFEANEYMMKAAKESASEQIEMLIEWMSLTRPRISVEFRS